jgi:hypothetical protein
MSTHQKKETLSDLLKEAANKFDVPLELLNKVLNEERIHLYLASSSRQNARRRLREIIQEESKNAIS